MQKNAVQQPNLTARMWEKCGKFISKWPNFPPSPTHAGIPYPEKSWHPGHEKSDTDEDGAASPLAGLLVARECQRIHTFRFKLNHFSINLQLYFCEQQIYPIFASIERLLFSTGLLYIGSLYAIIMYPMVDHVFLPLSPPPRSGKTTIDGKGKYCCGNFCFPGNDNIFRKIFSSRKLADWMIMRPERSLSVMIIVYVIARDVCKCVCVPSNQWRPLAVGLKSAQTRPTEQFNTQSQ